MLVNLARMHLALFNRMTKSKKLTNRLQQTFTSHELKQLKFIQVEETLSQIPAKFVLAKRHQAVDQRLSCAVVVDVHIDKHGGIPLLDSPLRRVGGHFAPVEICQSFHAMAHF